MVEKLKKGSELPVASDFGLDDTVFGLQQNVTKRFPGSALARLVSQFSQQVDYLQGTIGARAKTTVWVTDAPFNAKGNGTADDTAAILAAIAFVQAKGGGRVCFPAGTFACSAEIGMNPITGIGWHNLVLEGQGIGATFLDFSLAPANTRGVVAYGWGGRIALKGFAVKNSKGSGIELNPVNRGSGAFISRVYVEDVIVENSVLDGFRFTQTYMCSFRDIESRNSQGYGFNLRGSHTSMTFNRCWAGGDAVRPNGGNLAGGWNCNGLVYSSFESCSADNSGGPGWTFKATGGVTLTSCGSEANFGAGFLAISDDTNIDAIPTPGINGLILDGCFAVGNGAASTATPCFLELRTAGTRKGFIVLRGCYDIVGAPGSGVSTYLVGSGGEASIEEQACRFSGTRLKSGNSFYKNVSVQGRSSTVKLSADFLVPDGAATTLPFNTFDSNSMGAANIVGTTGELVIPAGVNRIRIAAGLFWNTNSTGARTLAILRAPAGGGAAATFYGAPAQKNVANGFTTQQVSSAVVEVTPGDRIIVQVTQNSGGNLSVIANPNTYLSVEAVG